MSWGEFFGDVVDGARETWRSLRALPRRAIDALRANPSRAIATVWVGGMATFAAVGGRDVYRAKVAEAALERELEKAKPVRPEAPPMIAEMMDVDEMNALRDNRMRANGIAAAGDKEGPDAAAIAKAQKELATVKVVEGEVAAKSGNVVVVSKGGLAGWMKRNKGKKADPETLAWLRAEEKASGGRMGTYAAWAEHDSTQLSTWFKLDKQRKAAAGSGSAAAIPTEAGVEPAPAAPPVAKPTPSTPTLDVEIDIAALGHAAVAAVAPVEPARAEALAAKLVAQDAVARDGRVRVGFAPKWFTGDELTAEGTAQVRALARGLGQLRGLRIVATSAEPIMEVATALAVGGVDSSLIEVVVDETAKPGVLVEVVP